ncbi:hypothetical protein DE146DRAFT_197522 [Phaeosphaeria sp. MPI-PUGE-AT-0046c]|nr:hypothetical protein DE146DRAFT_197522 [Phaeosphaeria sp. MPI-PUGE-AT-0046c]
MRSYSLSPMLQYALLTPLFSYSLSLARAFRPWPIQCVLAQLPCHPPHHLVSGPSWHNARRRTHTLHIARHIIFESLRTCLSFDSYAPAQQGSEKRRQTVESWARRPRCSRGGCAIRSTKQPVDLVEADDPARALSPTPSLFTCRCVADYTHLKSRHADPITNVDRGPIVRRVQSARLSGLACLGTGRDSASRCRVVSSRVVAMMGMVNWHMWIC